MLLNGAVIVLNSVCAWLESGSVRGALLMCLEKCLGRGANSLQWQLVIESKNQGGLGWWGWWGVLCHITWFQFPQYIY